MSEYGRIADVYAKRMFGALGGGGTEPKRPLYDEVTSPVVIIKDPSTGELKRQVDVSYVSGINAWDSQSGVIELFSLLSPVAGFLTGLFEDARPEKMIDEIIAENELLDKLIRRMVEDDDGDGVTRSPSGPAQAAVDPSAYEDMFKYTVDALERVDARAKGTIGDAYRTTYGAMDELSL